MAQNIYDDPEFFAGYSQLNRQVNGLEGAPEWPALKAMLPTRMAGSEVADLGCGFGWFSNWAITQGASKVHGYDLSDRMLTRARSLHPDPKITYTPTDLNTLVLGPASCDIVFSSLTFHYVEDIDRLINTIADGLRPGGSVVFSVEHPIYSATVQQQFIDLQDGRRVWPVENYLEEAERRTEWLGAQVVKHHRTVASYVNALLSAGLTLAHIDEFGTTTNPDDSHRPWFLLVGATKP